MTIGSADYRDSGLEFPSDFLLGSATAAYQIEGAVQEDGRGPSIWDTFSHTPGRTLGGDTGDVADDHYHRVDADLDLMKQIGLEAYRFSISWPRIQPTGAGKANQAGLSFYSRVVDGLLDRGIRPIATLYHWDLPQALEDAGGWPERDTAQRFAEYASIVGEALGDRVAVWTTLNEPWCSAFLGYGSGGHAPGRTNNVSAFRAAHHLMLGHGLAIRELRHVVAKPDAEYSITLNFHVPEGDDETSPEAIRRVDALGNRIFTGPLLRGEYPEDLLEDTQEFTNWDFVQSDDLETIKAPIDFLGVNFYSPLTVRMWDGKRERQTNDGHRKGGGSDWPSNPPIEFLAQDGPYTAMGWNISPSSFEDLLVSLGEQFPTLPLIITENGAAFDDVEIEGRVHDNNRIDYLRRHFTAVHRAKARGVDLRGYLVWSFMDNFEWGWGYSKRFGIVRVDYETQERIVKDSGLWLAELIASRRIPSLPDDQRDSFEK